MGMGLLSWCRSDDCNNARQTGEDNEEGYVIGKLVKDQGADALEVVMSLWEVCFLAFDSSIKIYSNKLPCKPNTSMRYDCHPGGFQRVQQPPYWLNIPLQA